MAATSPTPRGRSLLESIWQQSLVRWLLPLVLLGAVIATFWLTSGAGLNVQPVAPIEAVQFERTVLSPGVIELYIRNASPEPVTISAVNINDALWPFTMSPSATIPRLGSAVLTLHYPWVEASAYAIALMSTNSIAFTTEIPVAALTVTVSEQSLWNFTLVGIYVGIIPVFLGMLWLPVVRQLGPKARLFMMAATVGLLVYLGISATSEALNQAAVLTGPLQGVGIVAIGITGTILLLQAIGQRQASLDRSASGHRWTLAFMIAIGMGLHNLGEGLAIGAAYAIGEAALGTFLVIGFIIQNVTEGLGIVVPIANERVQWRRLLVLGLIGGAPAVVGAWIGGFVTFEPLAVFFLAIGAGAVFQVAYQIGRELVWRREREQQMPLTAFAGVTVGMLVLYVTGLLVS